MPMTVAKEMLSLATMQQAWRDKTLEQNRGLLQGKLFEKEKEKETQRNDY